MIFDLIFGSIPCRAGKQRLREARTQAVDFLILLLAGVCLGTLAKVSDESFGATGYTYTVIAVCKFHLKLVSHITKLKLLLFVTS